MYLWGSACAPEVQGVMKVHEDQGGKQTKILGRNDSASSQCISSYFLWERFLIMILSHIYDYVQLQGVPENMRLTDFFTLYICK